MSRFSDKKQSQFSFFSNCSWFLHFERKNTLNKVQNSDQKRNTKKNIADKAMAFSPGSSHSAFSQNNEQRILSNQPPTFLFGNIPKKWTGRLASVNRKRITRESLLPVLISNAEKGIYALGEECSLGRGYSKHETQLFSW